MTDTTKRIAGIVLNVMLIAVIVYFTLVYTLSGESRFDSSAMISIVLLLLSAVGLASRMVFDVPIVLTTTAYLVASLEVLLVTDEIFLPFMVISMVYFVFTIELIPTRPDSHESLREDQSIPDIELAEDEVLVRKYVISILDFRLNYLNAPMAEPPENSKYQTTGTFYITNRRFIYRVNSESLPRLKKKVADRFNSQLFIKDVRAVDMFVGRRKKYSITAYLMMAMGILAVIMALYDYESFTKLLPGALVFMEGLRWKVMGGMDPETSMKLALSSKTGGYPLAVTEMSRGYVGSVKFACRPTPQFEDLARDIGAVVLDFQKYGDEAIPKWKKLDDCQRDE